MKTEIKLGDKVRDKITGFTGIATSKTEFINGSIQYLVAPKVGKDNKMIEEIAIDEGSLEVISVKRKKVVKKETGGPMTRGLRMKGY